jgi:cytoskeletal protein CcmA (bactofilin family)
MFERTRKDSAAADAGAPAERADAPVAAQRAGGPIGAPRGQGTAVIGRSIRFRGDLHGDEDVRIEGDIEGNIHLPNHALTIGQEGRVRADAYAKSVIIDGEMQGDVYGAECVTIRATARVTGNVLASRVSLKEGARFKGWIDMDPESVKRALDGVTQRARTSDASSVLEEPRDGTDKPGGVKPEKPPKHANATGPIAS